jgi:tetratricopeptide (TPR) repeat protein
MGNKALEAEMECSLKKLEKILMIYLFLSQVYKQQGNILKAIEYIGKYIENACLSILPYDHDKILTCQTNYDDFITECVMYNTNSPNTLDGILIILNQQLERIPLDDSFVRINLLKDIGFIHMQKPNFEAAMKVFNQAISIYNQHKKSTAIKDQLLEQLMITVYFRLAKLYYYSLKNWSIALQIFEKSLNLALKQDRQHSMLPEIYNALGLTYSHLENYLKAEQHCRLAVETAENILSDDHPNLQRYRLQLKQMQCALSMAGIQHS